jgi:menaquinone-dependent protoporphyrinogen oxidase
MKRIARKSGGSTDTSRDHDYTDWAALDLFVQEFVEAIFPSALLRQPPRAGVA